MDGQKEDAREGRSLLARELLRYYDEFTEFSEDCAFLCDAFAALAATNEDLEPASLGGLERNAQWLKRRAGELKEKLRTIRQYGNGPS